jgi:DNA-binding IclR family transcriptional regulator
MEALAVAVVEPTWTDYHVAYRTGFRHPLDRGAAGRAILAARRDPGIDPGFSLTHGELEAGASGAAAPLLGVTGVEGSVGVVMLADSVPERVGPRVVEAAREVSDALR